MRLIWNFIFISLIVSGCYGDYPCLCNYNVETSVYGTADKASRPIGYLYEFDCKYIIKQIDKTWTKIAFEHMVGFVETVAGTEEQVCPGEVPDSDNIPTTAKTTTKSTITSTLSSTTMTKTPSTSLPPKTTSSLSTISVFASTVFSKTSYSLSSSNSTSSLISLLRSSHTPSINSNKSEPTFQSSPLSTSPINTTETSTFSSNKTSAFSQFTSTSHHISLGNLSSSPASISNISSSNMNETTTATSTMALNTSLLYTTTSNSTTLIISLNPEVFSTKERQNSTTFPVSSNIMNKTTILPNNNGTTNTTYQGTLISSNSDNITKYTEPAERSSTTSFIYITSSPSTSIGSNNSTTSETSSIVSGLTITNSSTSASVSSAASPSGHSTKVMNNTMTSQTMSNTFTTERVDLCPYKNLAMSMYNNQTYTYPLFHQYGNYCYELRLELGSWFEGQKDCVERGGELVVIKSKEVQTRVYDLVSSIQQKLDVWIGLHDLHQEGHWEWVDGDTVTSRSFNNGIVMTRVFNDGRDCVVMDGHTGVWKNTACQSILFDIRSQPWVCQYRIT